MNRKDQITLFGIIYDNRIFFSPFTKESTWYKNISDPLIICLKNVAHIINEQSSQNLGFSRINNTCFEKIKNKINKNTALLCSENMENYEILIFHLFYKKINNYVEKRNHMDFLCFLRSALFLRALNEYSFSSLFGKSKIVKAKLNKNIDTTYENLKNSLEVSQFFLNDYLDRFEKITKNHGICPYKMSSFNVTSSLFDVFLNDRIRKNNKTDIALNILNIETKDSLSENPETENLYGEVFKRFIQPVVIFNNTFGKKLFSYEKAVSFLSNKGNTTPIISKTINDWKTVISNEKKNKKRIVIHNNSSFETFFTVFMKNKDNDLENFLHTLGFVENGLKFEKLPNGKIMERVTIAYDLDSIKEIASLLN